MIIFLKKELSLQDEKKFRNLLVEKNIEVIPVVRRNQKLFVVVGRFGELTKREVQESKYVESILEVDRPYKLSSKSAKQGSTVIKINGLTIGNREIIYMAGPCSVETKSQIRNTAQKVAEAGCQVLRGGEIGR